MQKHKVDIVRFELAQTIQYRRFRFFIAVILYPYFSRQKDYFARNARICDSVANFFLVKIALRRIQMTVPDFQSVENASLAFVFRHLIHYRANHCLQPN